MITTAAPVKFPQHNQRTVIHPRSPALEIDPAKFPDIPAQTAIAAGRARPKFDSIRPQPDPAQSPVLSQVDFFPSLKVDQPISKETANVTFAALPRNLPESTRAAHDSDPDTNPGDLRGLFTGKVRQRIASAKYYPRMARRRGMEGQPVIAFTLDKGGRLTKVGLAQTSGYQLLDQAALEAVHRAAPYPEIPAELKVEIYRFKLPISFVLK
ncbi:MAG: energy transducer TonB [Nitrospinota bacterium]|nr:energy transducer TonB [Nitrospinota bacterium]